MYLCLDVGNSQIFGGVFKGSDIILRFRHETHRQTTSDQLGIFLTSVLRENKIEVEQITRIAISSVVPPIDYSLGSACIKYFDKDPFWLRPGVKTGLKLKTKHTNEVGADLIATAISASANYPNQNIIVVDLGTATTFVPINAEKEFLGVVIQAGIRTCMHALQSATEQLPTVQILQPKTVLGRDTVSSIQSGLYYGQLGAVREIIRGISAEVFHQQAPVVIGTGGFSSLFEGEHLFTNVDPDLVLKGLKLSLEMNPE